MFKLSTNPSFTHTVTVSVPVDGGHEDQKFKATFAVLPSDREQQHDLTTTEGSNDFLRTIVTGLDDIADEQGQPIPYNDRMRDQLIALPYVRVGLVKAYFAAIGKAIEGN